MTAHVLVVDADAGDARKVQAVLLNDGISAAVADSAGAALALAAVRPPDLLVVALDLESRDDGSRLAAAIAHRWGATVVFLLGGLAAAASPALLAVDPVGVVSKPLDDRQLRVTLRFALHRHRYLASRADRRSAAGDVLDALPDYFRPREREVVRLLLQHHRVPAIAQRLGISALTVRNHLKRAFKATDTHSQQELLDWLRPVHAGQPGPPAGGDDRRARMPAAGDDRPGYDLASANRAAAGPTLPAPPLPRS